MVVWLCHARVAHRQAPIKRNPSYVCTGDFLHLGVRKSPRHDGNIALFPRHYGARRNLTSFTPHKQKHIYTTYQYINEITAFAVMTVLCINDVKVL